ncbi:hypothetical protein BGX33_000436 [Mortierella sp. NVP41]|nr:hypothetical protein BGX33_000436 [Mortierella sp. NVP41]
MARAAKQKAASHLFPSYTQNDNNIPSASAQDEFKIFSQGTTPTLWNPHTRAHLHTSTTGGARGGQADIAECLKQRQEYYAREAHIRSLDRHDGLGPIVDFSKPHPHSHSSHHHLHPHTASRLEEDLVNKPTSITEHLHQQQIHFGAPRCSSQLEQVWMDLGPGSIPAQTNNRDPTDMETAWNNYSEGASISSAATVAPSHAHAAFFGPSGASSFREAAASLHSPWPMASWAIEAEAALMEVETIHHQHTDTARYDPRVHWTPHHYKKESQTTTAGAQDSSWAREFSHAGIVLGAGSNTRKSEEELETVTQDKHRDRRGSTVKTCAFMLEAKNHRDASDPTFIDPKSFAFTSADTARATVPFGKSDIPSGMSASEQLSISHPPVYHEPIDQQPISASHMDGDRIAPRERLGQVFNDDPFEGDMLQAWMETLAQEKQEADERVQEQNQVVEDVVEKKSAEEEAKDQMVLEVALRRLNALMHQLDRSQGFLKASFGGAGRNTSIIPTLPIREHTGAP